MKNKIKVIAIDMDGTLISPEQTITKPTLEKLNEADKAGIRIIINTGRNCAEALAELEKYDIKCDYIFSSGADVRDRNLNVLKRICMNSDSIRKVYEIAHKNNASIKLCSDMGYYVVGTDEEIKSQLMKEAELFKTFLYEDALNSDLFKVHLKKTKSISDIEDVLKRNISIYKIFLSDSDVEKLDKMNEEYANIPDIVSASSFRNNIEITDIKAQKGLVLLEYIEELGYDRTEVMTIGDSMNDYSMINMDFGITVAMGNADEDIKNAAKVVTKSNAEDGVAWCIECILNNEPEKIG